MAWAEAGTQRVEQRFFVEYAFVAAETSGIVRRAEMCKPRTRWRSALVWPSSCAARL